MAGAPRFRLRSGLIALLGLILLVMVAGRAVTLVARTSANTDDRLPVVAVSGYHVSLFTSASASAEGNAPVSNPDSVAVDGRSVFIDYQNVTSKTGGDGKFSTVVEYNLQGHELRRWNVSGHSDGMRVDPATHKVWTTSNEDGNATFALIDPVANTVTSYTFPPAPHGGGYDDLYFLGGNAYVAASNPSKNPNTDPAVDRIVLNSGTHTISLTPVLFGNATTTDKITLNLQDPDSLSTDGKGNLVLISQADSQIITIANPGTTGQAVAMITVGTQIDDTVYPSGTGRLLVVDAGGNTYWISKDSPFAPGSIYTEAPNDSGVTNFVGTVDATTGFITPFAVGFTKATGMVFVPDVATSGDSGGSGD